MFQEYIREREAERLAREFEENWDSYQKKPEEQTDTEWLKGLILRKCRLSEEEAQREAAEIVEFLDTCEKSKQEVEAAARQGRSKEEWLGEKLQESAIGLSAARYSETLQGLDDLLYQQNQEMAEALSRAKDGHISMNPNLDGNIAEHMVGRSTQLQGYLQNKNIKVEIRDVNTANSVDVRVTNLDTGKYQNYQMKYGKDAKATIRMIEEGNYNNQRLVVPPEQLEEVRTYFEKKGSQKTITDHIEMDGVKGRAFTKAEVERMRDLAQKSNQGPKLEDCYYSTKEYALQVGKNAGVMALQMAAVTTGIDLAVKVCQGKEIQAEEVAETALRTGVDTGVKVTAAGTLHSAVRTGGLPFLPKNMGTDLITGIAFVGVENAKVLLQMAEGKLSTLKGLDQMGKVTVSMAGGLGLMGLVQGAVSGLLGGPVGVAAGLVSGMVGYAAGSGIGSRIYSGAKKIAGKAKEMGRRALDGLRKGAEMVRGAVQKIPVIGWFC